MEYIYAQVEGTTKIVCGVSELSGEVPQEIYTIDRVFNPQTMEVLETQGVLSHYMIEIPSYIPELIGMVYNFETLKFENAPIEEITEPTV